MSEWCVLNDRECIDCGECDLCDIDKEKHCDNCGLCIDDIDDYRSVSIDDFIKSNITKEQIEKINEKLNKNSKDI